MTRPGDIGFAHSNGLMGRLIRVGEFLSFRRGSNWNHAFVVEHVLESGDCLLIQATLRGVTDNGLLSEISDYRIVSAPEGVDRERVLTFARAQVGMEYGVLTVIAIAIDIVTWQWFPAFRGARKPSWICSALVGESLRFGGWLHRFIDIYTVTPAQLYELTGLGRG